MFVNLGFQEQGNSMSNRISRLAVLTILEQARKDVNLMEPLNNFDDFLGPRGDLQSQLADKIIFWRDRLIEPLSDVRTHAAGYLKLEVMTKNMIPLMADYLQAKLGDSPRAQELNKAICRNFEVVLDKFYEKLCEKLGEKPRPFPGHIIVGCGRS